ncbi:MAG: hypothetical protein WBD23_06115 [Candidatus Acidiferrales bacterium]
MLIVLWGCGSTLPTAEQGKGMQQPEQAAGAPSAAAGSDNPGIDLKCVAIHIGNAPAPFHWSYKKKIIGLSDADWEAEITPDSIAGTFIDSSGTHSIHGARSDGTSWNTAVMTLTGPLPASTFALVNNSSATVRAGAQEINDGQVIEYRIDTSKDTPADASLIRSVLGAGGFIKGTAWVTPEGCPVKFSLDVEQHNQDGTVEKEHYEANVTKP